MKVLRGDPNQVATVADSLEFEHKYTSSVIAWSPEDSAGRGFEAAGQTLGEGLQGDRRSVERAVNHIRQIEQPRFGPERDFGPSR